MGMCAMNDTKYMKIALRLSQRGRGFTEPNPMVGAVVVKDNQILSTGYHRRCGCDHAERDALSKIHTTGADLYVTLEPCVHYGRTPPCADLIIEKKIKRVVIAIRDPNPQVNGKGVQKLLAHGIQVEENTLSRHARHINRHYLKYIGSGMPYVTLKAGLSLDGKLTDKFRKSQWVTSEELRTVSHSLRGEFSGIMVGSKTVLDDDPQLNIRDPQWVDKKFYRIVLDTHNRLEPGKYRLFNDQERFPLLIFSSVRAADQTPRTRHHYFINPGAEGGLDLTEVLQTLHRLHISSVMVEGGGTLFNSFLKQKLYDEIIVGQSKAFIGGIESLQFFSEGAPVSAPIELNHHEVIKLETGQIIRGYRE